MLTTDQKHELQIRLAGAIANVDRAGLLACSVEDITWTLPGSSRVSGSFVGADEVLNVGRTFAEVGYHFEVENITFGPDDVAVILRATGARNGRTVDEAVVNVVGFAGDRVASIVTHLSDVEGFNAYFS
jgi:uncharacterized protein